METAAKLRAVIDAARADIRVLAYRIESRRQLVGDEPTQCPRGHLLVRNAHGQLSVHRRHATCSCGGHTIYICDDFAGAGRCGAETIDPQPSYDCEVRWPR